MSFSNLFDSGFKSRNQSHFAAIVRVAMADGVITDDEKKFLDRLVYENKGIEFNVSSSIFFV